MGRVIRAAYRCRRRSTLGRDGVGKGPTGGTVSAMPARRPSQPLLPRPRPMWARAAVVAELALVARLAVILGRMGAGFSRRLQRVRRQMDRRWQDRQPGQPAPGESAGRHAWRRRPASGARPLAAFGKPGHCGSRKVGEPERRLRRDTSTRAVQSAQRSTTLVEPLPLRLHRAVSILSCSGHLEAGDAQAACAETAARIVMLEEALIALLSGSPGAVDQARRVLALG